MRSARSGGWSVRWWQGGRGQGVPCSISHLKKYQALFLRRRTSGRNYLIDFQTQTFDMQRALIYVFCACGAPQLRSMQKTCNT